MYALNKISETLDEPITCIIIDIKNKMSNNIHF